MKFLCHKKTGVAPVSLFADRVLIDLILVLQDFRIVELYVKNPCHKLSGPLPGEVWNFFSIALIIVL
jgi:hypothetical protein